MARKLRIQYVGAIYHLMNRGDRREPIFKDDLDHRRFLATLGESLRQDRLADVEMDHPTVGDGCVDAPEPATL